MSNFKDLQKGLNSVKVSNNNSGKTGKFNFSNIYDYFSDKTNESLPVSETLDCFSYIHSIVKEYDKKEFLALNANKKVRNKLQDAYKKISAKYSSKETTKEEKLKLLQNCKIALQIFNYTPPAQISINILNDLKNLK